MGRRSSQAVVVRFAPTADELARMHRHVVSSRGWLRWLRMGVPLWAATVLATTLAARGPGGLVEPGALLVIALLALWAADPLLTRWRAERMLRRHGAAPVKYRLDPEGLHVPGGTLGWDQLTRVDETREAFIFTVRPRGGVYVPKRALAGPQEILRLRNLLETTAGGRARLRRD